jgi:hypothetical protein
MFEGTTSQGGMLMRAQDIFTRLRDALHDAEDYQDWLTAQTDADLGQPDGLGFSAQQITFLRSAFNAVTAADAVIHNGLPPAGYPQPPATHDYWINAKQIVGPG